MDQYIDKTGHLEEGIRRFPSIYIEGNAAIGKSTAVRMLLKKHPEVTFEVLEADREAKHPEEYLKRLREQRKLLKNGSHWLILDRIPERTEPDIAELLCTMVREIDNDGRVIFISREKPQLSFLKLLWEGNMELITGEKFLFSFTEVSKYIKMCDSLWNAKDLWDKTGGWAGCIRMLIYMEKSHGIVSETQRKDLYKAYEMKLYIREEILGNLTAEENQLLSHAASCPWIKESLCAKVWGIKNAPELLEKLRRKGMLLYEYERKYWKINPLFRDFLEKIPLRVGVEDAWYEEGGYLLETFWCMEQLGDDQAYYECMMRNYGKGSSMGRIGAKALNREGEDPRDCYFRGVFAYQNRQFTKLEKEISLLEKSKASDRLTREVLLNLYFLDSRCSLEDWLERLRSFSKDGEKFQIYHLLGNGATFLAGTRDLSELFLGTRKEIEKREKLWKQALGDFEWKAYRLARTDFYLETEQREKVPEEDKELLWTEDLNESWQIRMVKFYLLCKLQRLLPEEGRGEKIFKLEQSLKNDNYAVCGKNAEAIGSLYSLWSDRRDRLTKWLWEQKTDNVHELNDDNFLSYFCAAKGYILLNKYEKAERMLNKLIPYVQSYHRYSMLAELLFQQAIVYWKKDLKGQALRCVIESFMACGDSRYVGIYASYGQRGAPVLNAYVDWQCANSPENWSRKKKYNYGNVLRMPMEDYIQVILRRLKKSAGAEPRLQPEYEEESLTMMETLVLQKIGAGLTNAQICEELGLKLPTVKGHAYSLFRKLEVKNRIQAVRRGKELGIIK